MASSSSNSHHHNNLLEPSTDHNTTSILPLQVQLSVPDQQASHRHTALMDGFSHLPPLDHRRMARSIPLLALLLGRIRISSTQPCLHRRRCHRAMEHLNSSTQYLLRRTTSSNLCRSINYQYKVHHNY